MLDYNSFYLLRETSIVFQHVNSPPHKTFSHSLLSFYNVGLTDFFFSPFSAGERERERERERESGRERGEGGRGKEREEGRGGGVRERETG